MKIRTKGLLLLVVLVCGRLVWGWLSDRYVQRVLESAMGGKVIVAATPLQLSEKPTLLIAPPDTKTLNASPGICVVVPDHGPLKGMETRLEAHLAGATIKAVVLMDDGKNYELDNPGSSWTRAGVITGGDELAACVYGVRSWQQPPKGSTLKSVSIVTSAPVSALGVYWDSPKPKPHLF